VRGFGVIHPGGITDAVALPDRRRCAAESLLADTGKDLREFSGKSPLPARSTSTHGVGADGRFVASPHRSDRPRAAKRAHLVDCCGIAEYALGTKRLRVVEYSRRWTRDEFDIASTVNTRAWRPGTNPITLPNGKKGSPVEQLQMQVDAAIS
jgi:hypothetical protein